VRWIISAGKDIAVDRNQMGARREYIQRVSGVEVSPWIKVNGPAAKEYFCCMSDDGIDGTFITAHIDDVYNLCSLKEICLGKLVVANTCIWERMSDKQLLFRMMSVNREVELFFAKQELSVENNRILRQTTTLIDIGQFGFQTSKSERLLYRNRDKGLMKAIKMSFNRVSPVILLGD
jgi:hypothetical protein